jgi:hypothetical protein
MFFVSYMIIVPYAAYTRGNSNIIATTFLFDVVITFILCALVAAKARRWDILSAFPHIYLYRWVVLFVFLRSLIDVFVLRRFKSSDGTWANDSTRRYKPVAIG